MKRFKILCLLLLVFIFAGIVQSFFVNFMGGFNSSSSILEWAEEKDVNYNSYVALDVKVNDIFSLTSYDVNKCTGDSVMVIPERATVIAPQKQCNHTTVDTSYTNFLFVLKTLLSVIIMTVNIVLLVYFVRIILVFTRKDFFDKRITRWLSFVGYAFVSLSVLLSIWHLVKVYYTTLSVQLTNYAIEYGATIDFDSLTTGLIVLVVNEILKSAIGMKQEQDLTI